MLYNYVSIDIETTGLDESQCQVIQFGAVLDNFDLAFSDLPKLSIYVLSRSGEYHWEEVALKMNAELKKEIDDLHQKINSDPEFARTELNKTFTYPDQLHIVFKKWLVDNHFNENQITVAGKNFSSFDVRFLKSIDFIQLLKEYCGVEFHRRVLDIGSMFYDPKLDPKTLPDLSTCLARVGLTLENHHHAFYDALAVSKCIRSKFNISIN